MRCSHILEYSLMRCSQISAPVQYCLRLPIKQCKQAIENYVKKESKIIYIYIYIYIYKISFIATERSPLQLIS